MEHALAKAAVWHDPQGLSGLRQGAREQSPESLQAAAEQFEALFVARMMAAMRETVPDEGLFTGRHEGMYREMMDRQLALDIVRGRGFGLADAIVRQVGGGGNVVEAGAPASLTPATVEARPPAPAWRPESPADFVDAIAPHARRAADQLGVDPRVLVAQAALETGWGRYTITRADGGSSFNVFNIKAGDDWEGPRVAVSTLEYRDGIAQRERAAFRAYGSLAAGFDDYVSLIRGERYSGARAGAGDAGAYVRKLAEAGYATDPDYADKVLGLMARPEIAALGPGQGTPVRADTGKGMPATAATGVVRARTETSG